MLYVIVCGKCLLIFQIIVHTRAKITISTNPSGINVISALVKRMVQYIAI